MTMARVKLDPETKKIVGTEKKDGRAERGVTIRWPDAVTEVRFQKFMEDYQKQNPGTTRPDVLGFILSDYLKDYY